MSIISENRRTHRAIVEEVWTEIRRLLNDEHNQLVKLSAEEEQALRELMEVAESYDGGKGFTAAQLEQMANGTFSKQEIVGNLIAIGKHNDSRYVRLNPRYNPIKVDVTYEERKRNFAEIDERGQVIPGTEFVKIEGKNRYHFHK